MTRRKPVLPVAAESVEAGVLADLRQLRDQDLLPPDSEGLAALALALARAYDAEPRAATAKELRETLLLLTRREDTGADAGLADLLGAIRDAEDS
jgi:hypothetical protein